MLRRVIFFRTFWVSGCAVYNVLNDLHKVDISAVMKTGQDGDFKSRELQKTGVILTFGILLKDDGSARSLFQTLKPFVCFWFYGI